MNKKNAKVSSKSWKSSQEKSKHTLRNKGREKFIANRYEK